MYKLYLILFTIITFCNSVLAQNGYVKLKNDSIIEGYIKYEKDIQHPEYGKKIKVYRTKTDKKPMSFFEKDIKEHALKKDTIVVLTGLYLNDKHYPYLAAKPVVRAEKISLFLVEVLKSSYSGAIPHTHTEFIHNTPVGVTSYNAIQTVRYKPVYILLHHGTNYKKTISENKQQMILDLEEFIDDKTLLDSIVYNKLKYTSLPDIVRIYNNLP